MTARSHASIALALALVGLVPLHAAVDEKDQPKLKLTEDERVLVELTNKERKKAGLAELKPNAVLFKAARSHTKNMATQRQLRHTLDGKTLSDRLEAAGYEYTWIGENIAAGQGLSLEGALKNWMESPDHRANILKDGSREIGIGIARTADGETYFSQVFGAPVRKR